MFVRLIVIIALLAVAVAWGARRSDGAGDEQVYVVRRATRSGRSPPSHYGGRSAGGRLAAAGPQPPRRHRSCGRARARCCPSRHLDCRANPAWTSTSSSWARPARCRRPTARPTALLVRRGGERLLFDCAEGTQRQMLRSTLGLIDLREVFLTHYHADHYLGLPGMLKTFALRGREAPITIYGPPGLGELFALAAQDLREADVPVRARRAAGRATCSTRGGYRLVDVPGRAPRVVGRLRARRGRPARAVRRRDRRLGSASHSALSADALQRGEADHARRRHDRHARPGAGRVTARPDARDRRRHGAHASRARGARRTQTCSSTRRPSSRTSGSARSRPRTRPRSTPRSSGLPPASRCSP